MSEEALREELARAARESVALGLNHGTTGNLSVRTPGGFLITPAGARCDAVGPDELVEVALGTRDPRPATASSEWRLHRDLYLARADVHAVVHAHPRFSATLACLRQDLPAVHYMVAVTGGSTVRCAEYATFGTEALSRAAVTAMGRSRACLLANHGLVAVGRNLEEALRVAVEVESVAELWWRAKAVGEPVVLTEAQMEEVITRFETYGHRS